MTNKAAPSTFKLKAKLIPLLMACEDPGSLKAKLVGESGKETILQLDDGITVNVNSKELGIKMGNSPSGWVYFDKDGQVTTHELAEPPKREKSSRSGSAVSRPIPPFN